MASIRWPVAYHVARSAVVCVWGEFGTLERVDAENLELGTVCFGCLDFWSLRCRASGNLELRVARRLFASVARASPAPSFAAGNSRQPQRMLIALSD